MLYYLNYGVLIVSLSSLNHVLKYGQIVLDLCTFKDRVGTRNLTIH